MKQTRGVLITAVLMAIGLSLSAAQPKAWVPEKGFVPDSQTAIRIAEAVWIPIYGEKLIAGEKPFRAVLRGDTWFVEGTLPAGYEGGTAIAEIAKRDGRILRVIHEQ